MENPLAEFYECSTTHVAYTCLTLLKDFGDSKIAEKIQTARKPSKTVLGVRIPPIDRLATEVTKTRSGHDDAASVSDLLRDSRSHEEEVLAVRLLRSAPEKLSWNRLTLWRALLDNWLVTDELGFVLGDRLSLMGTKADFGRLVGLTQSESAWVRRLCLVAAIRFGKEEKWLNQALTVASMLWVDSDPRVRKARDWMLRSTGKIFPHEVSEFFFSFDDHGR